MCESSFKEFKTNKKNASHNYIMPELIIRPIKISKQKQHFDLSGIIYDSVRGDIQTGDILVVSSKFVSYSQGRLIDKKVKRSKLGYDLATKLQMSLDIAEVVIREADKIHGGVAGFALATSDDIMAPNAGVDGSNGLNSFILYPKEPYVIAQQIRKKIFLESLKLIGIIISDSRLLPARVGTCSVAIACAGMEPIKDKRATMDLEKKPLRVTLQATADSLATSANHVMGEGDESVPVVLIRGSNVTMTDRKIYPDEMTIPYDQCIYVKSLSHSINV